MVALAKELSLFGYGSDYEMQATKPQAQASASHLDLGRTPFDLYGVEYIDPVSLAGVYVLQREAAGGTQRGGDAPHRVHRQLCTVPLYRTFVPYLCPVPLSRTFVL